MIVVECSACRMRMETDVAEYVPAHVLPPGDLTRWPRFCPGAFTWLTAEAKEQAQAELRQILESVGVR